MLFKRLNTSNAVAGAVAIIVGVYAVWEASGYTIGQLSRIGPGFFPIVLGLIMIGLGIGIVLERGPAVAQRDSDEESADDSHKPRFRALVFITASVAAFILLADTAGLIPAVAAIVLISALADPKYPVLHAIVLAIGLSVIISVIFVMGFGLPLPLIGF